MNTRRFLLFNALGAIAWSTLFGVGSYMLGREIEHVSTWMGMALGATALATVGAGILFVRHNRKRLQVEADRHCVA